MRRLLPLVLLTVGCSAHRAPMSSSPLPPYQDPSVTCEADAEGTVTGVVKHETTGRPLGSALVILQSPSLQGDMEVATDSSGRYRFRGLPPGTYTILVLVGQANVSKVVTLPESGKLSADFKVDPHDDICKLRSVERVPPDESLFSVTDEREARMLRVPRTIVKY